MIFGTILVAIASLLWATDAAFRVPSLRAFHPATIVFIEHVLSLVILLPLALIRKERLFPDFNRSEWFAAAWIGMGGSGVATLLFTSSFQYLNPSVAILLQKLQPIMVVFLAILFLGERPRFSFYPWAAIALLAATILAFPDLNFDFLVKSSIDPRSRGVLFALLAAAIWGVSTVAGKKLLARREPLQTTRARYLFGTLASLVSLLILVPNSHSEEVFTDFSSLFNLSNGLSLMYIAWIPGLAAMMIYYTGMKKTPAVVTTFAELMFPLGAILVNTLYLEMPLEPIQILAGATLIGAVTLITLSIQRPESMEAPFSR